MRAFWFAVVTSLFVSTGSTAQALQVIDLLPGDTIGNNTVITAGTTVNDLGGSIGLGVYLSNGVLNIDCLLYTSPSPRDRG